MSVWGGPHRRIHGVLFFEMLSGVCFVIMGLLKVAVTVAGYLYPRIRHVEQELPDAVAFGLST